MVIIMNRQYLKRSKKDKNSPAGLLTTVNKDGITVYRIVACLSRQIIQIAAQILLHDWFGIDRKRNHLHEIHS